MKKIFLTMLLSLMCVSGHAFASVDTDDALKFVKKVANEGVEEIVDANIPQAEKINKFRTLFNRDLDLDFIGKFVLGRYWKTATPKQKTDFIAAYKELNVKTWSGRFDEFKGKDFVFQDTTPSSTADQLFVNSTVDMGKGQSPAKVVWRVRQDSNGFRIVDIIIENVSLAITARNEYAAFIKKSPDGVDGLIKNLQSKVSGSK